VCRRVPHAEPTARESLAGENISAIILPRWGALRLTVGISFDSARWPLDGLILFRLKKVCASAVVGPKRPKKERAANFAALSLL
jgi:hypothetical protein